MKRTILGIAIATMVLSTASVAVATPDISEANKVAYWCETGVKYEPVDTPFIVPAPPEGTTWTLIVLKAGTTNETHLTPVSGQSYSHSQHENSHVILCYEALVITTTTTTEPPTTTTTANPVTTTTVVDTTTTVPETTTSSSTTTTDPTTTTTPSSTTTSMVTTTSTVPPTTTTIPEVVTDLPNTGANLTAFGLIGMVLLLMGGLAVWKLRTD